MTEPRNLAEVRAAWDGLSPAVRAQMAEVGITGPDFSGSGHGHDHAPIEAVLDRHAAVPAAPAADSALDVLREKLDAMTPEELLAWIEHEREEAVKRESALLLHRIIWRMTRKGVNVRLSAWALAFATGLDCVMGVKSQREVAARFGEDRQALNYYVKLWRNELGFATRKFCRTEQAREASRERAKRVHGQKTAQLWVRRNVTISISEETNV